MLAETAGYCLSGINGFPVSVEVFTSPGLPALEIIGLPDASIRESRDRVNAAILNSGFRMPVARTTVNLAPADLKKEGPGFDLPIAVGVMIAGNLFQPAFDISKTVMIGELSLDGSIQSVRGILPMVISAKENGYTDIILPYDNAREVSTIESMRIYPASHLSQVVRHICDIEHIDAQMQTEYREIANKTSCDVDMSQIKGQFAAKRALEVAAAGGHNMLMIGSPGSGKSMLARSLPGILPPMSFSESLETTKIHSIAGKLGKGEGLITVRPFCSPHHSASVASLIGGGPNARPGEISLAHNGVLFLDELPEFQRNVLESLRQPLEDGVVSVSRIRSQACYQSRFMLIASMNPCPCGYFGSTQRECRCTSRDIRRYLDRISGPLLDRIDLQIEIDAAPVNEINNALPGESSATVAERVGNARKLQQERYAQDGIHCNAQLTNEMIRKYCRTDDTSRRLLSNAVEKMGLSMRAYSRVLKVARTVADLRGSEQIESADIAEAIQYRELDQRYWG